MAFEILLVRLCHLVAVPDLQQVLLDNAQKQNPVAQKVSENNDELVNEILRNFEGSKLI